MSATFLNRILKNRTENNCPSKAKKSIEDGVNPVKIVRNWEKFTISIGLFNPAEKVNTGEYEQEFKQMFHHRHLSLIAFSLLSFYQKNLEMSFQILLFYLRFLAMR